MLTLVFKRMLALAAWRVLETCTALRKIMGSLLMAQEICAGCGRSSDCGRIFGTVTGFIPSGAWAPIENFRGPSTPSCVVCDGDPKSSRTRMCKFHAGMHRLFLPSSLCLQDRLVVLDKAMVHAQAEKLFITVPCAHEKVGQLVIDGCEEISKAQETDRARHPSLATATTTPIQDAYSEVVPANWQGIVKMILGGHVLAEQ